MHRCCDHALGVFNYAVLSTHAGLRQRRRGALTLEWILLVTILIIGTVGGVAAVRNALILEYVEMIETICAMSIGP